MTTFSHRPNSVANLGPVLHITPKARPDLATPKRILVPLRRVLIVDFRDEVYACLRSDLLPLGIRVARAASADEAACIARRFGPQLVLVNAGMPDESGWLICAKMQLCHEGMQVWVYVPRLPQCRNVVQAGCRADEVIEYGGVLFRLVERVRWAIQRAGQPSTSVRARLPLRQCFRFDGPSAPPGPPQTLQVSQGTSTWGTFPTCRKFQGHH